jgi:MFS family permease
MIGEAVFAAVIIAMEVPSGWLSDIWSRRKTLIVGCGFAAAGYAIIMTANGFWQAVLGQAVIGIGVACNSGTVTSLLYDTLAAKGKEHLYQRLEGKRHAMGLYAVAAASVIGGILYQFDGRLPIMLDIITLVIAMGCAAFMVEPERIKRAAEKTPLHDMIITIKYALHDHKEIAGIIMVSTILFCSTKMFMWAQQPYMQYVGISTDYFGYIMAAGFLFGGFVGHFGHKIRHPLSNRMMIGFLVGLCYSLSIFAALVTHQTAIICILLISGVWGFGFPFVQNAINKYADPARRATILSTLGLLISLMFIPASIILGWLTDEFSIRHGLIYLAAQLAFIAIIGFLLWARGVKKLKPTL